ncbi:MAG: MarR family transcriptional regulator [Crenarchaeota archaeon]|nr:MarR family transcriptional regulator [Thermoproteota archaeon]
MPTDIILVILYIASFAALYSLFSTRVHKLLRENKKRKNIAEKEVPQRKEENTRSEEYREPRGQTSQEVLEETSIVPEPVIVDKEDNVEEEVRKLVAQLSHDEVRVLKFLLERGGECYQMEIYRTLGLPKSTVTKIVHRLSEKGILIVERRGRYNYVKLRQKDLVKKLVSLAQLVA